jgi:hypothetical protein
VIIGLGSFDAWGYENWDEDFVIDYSALIDSFAALPSKPVIWICTAPWFISSPYGHDIKFIKDTINPLIQQVGTLKNVPVIDWYAFLEDKPLLFAANGFNWNIEGAQFIAEIVAAEIVRAYWPPDFNGDSKVNIEDLVILIEHWGQNESSVDIAPRPLGDGIVDIQDLELLMSYWRQEPEDPTLAAHWALDEIEGITTHDRVNGNDDYVMGGARWRPTGGVIDGALELDGVDDCLIASFGPNPAEGPFSVVAWIKGGAPGQVIFSQPVRADWLMINTEGKLMTELRSSDGLAGPLLSEVMITDGQWHRIGLVWDGLQRKLCIDGVVVAKDIQDGLEAYAGGLYVGVGKNYTPGSFFSGLIDDIRIYNRVVSP